MEIVSELRAAELRRPENTLQIVALVTAIDKLSA